MKDDQVTDALLRQFLLGQIDDEQRQRIESLFLTDPQFRERILGIEQDLIEDYLEDSLTTADREKFLLRYGATPAQRRQLRITKSVKEWAIKEANVAQFNPPAISIWSRVLAGLKLKPTFVVPIAVTTMIAIAVTAFWLNSQRQQRNREYVAKQEELAQLNDPSNLREVPLQDSLTLSPVAVRSGDRQAELTRRPDLQVVELRLLWIRPEKYPSYRAVIQRVGDGESFTVDRLHAQENGGQVIRLKLPVSLLTRGLYRIQVSGVDESGVIIVTEEFNFTVNS